MCTAHPQLHAAPKRIRQRTGLRPQPTPVCRLHRAAVHECTVSVACLCMVCMATCRRDACLLQTEVHGLDMVMPLAQGLHMSSHRSNQQKLWSGTCMTSWPGCKRAHCKLAWKQPRNREHAGRKESNTDPQGLAGATTLLVGTLVDRLGGVLPARLGGTTAECK